MDKLAELNYADIAVYCLVATAAFALLHMVGSKVVGGKGERPDRPKWGLIEKLLYLGLAVTVIVLGVTSLYSVIPAGAMHGWWLFAHLVAAGAFVGLVTLVGLIWMRRNLMFDSDLKFITLARFAFWVILIGAVGAIGSVLVAMFGLVGGRLMHDAVDIHRYSGLAVVCGLILHLYAVALMKIRVK
jgi:hypothetical protein